MLVYTNHVAFTGPAASEAIFRGIGGWLKEQLGFGLHPEQLTNSGEFNGKKGSIDSWLRIDATSGAQPALYAWTLKHIDDVVRGRQWITELGLKDSPGQIELSCVVRTDELSALVADPVVVARPRVIGYVISNVRLTSGADFLESVPGLSIRRIGQDIDSYRSFLSDIERPERDYPIVLVSPDPQGLYHVNTARLQDEVLGLAQVVETAANFNSYEMEEVLGRRLSAWGGAVNLIHAPRANGAVFSRIFLSNEITSWGQDQRARIAKILAWVTSNTNVTHLRDQIRPEGVRREALRRRLLESRANADQMSIAQLQSELTDVWNLANDFSKANSALQSENKRLQIDLLGMEEGRQEDEHRMSAREYEISALKDRLERAGGGRVSSYDIGTITDLACRQDQPSPEECLNVLEELHSDKCVILPSARASAKDYVVFQQGRRLLGLLIRLVTLYRTALIEGGDAAARMVFSTGEFAAQESETVMSNPAARRQRLCEYRGEEAEMCAHLKIGIADDGAKTVRVHFHWDSDRQLIVIGHCGRHLTIPGR